MALYDHWKNNSSPYASWQIGLSYSAESPISCALDGVEAQQLHPKNFGSFAPDHSVTTPHFGMKDPVHSPLKGPWQTCVDKRVHDEPIHGEVLTGSRHNTRVNLDTVHTRGHGIYHWSIVENQSDGFFKAKLTGSRMQCVSVSCFSFWLNSSFRLISHDVWHCFHSNSSNVVAWAAVDNT